MTETRTLPDDFAEIAATRSRMAIAKHYRMGLATVDRFIRETNAPRPVGKKGKKGKHKKAREKRAVPADFPIYAKILTKDALCRHFQAGAKTIDRFFRETGAARAPAPVIYVMPDGFADRMYESLSRLAEEFDVHPDTITRWRRKCGWVRPVVAKPVEFKRATPPKSTNVTTATWGNGITSIVPPRDASLAGEARDHLRRIGYQNVYDRGKVLGRKYEGTFQVGRLVMDEAGMIALAVERGMGL